MTPIDETDLRHELRDVAPLDDDDLTAQVMGRGRTVRTRRRIVAGVSGVAALALIAFGASALVPLLRPTVGIPAGSPSVSAPVSPSSPTAKPTSATSTPTSPESPGGDSPLPKALGTVAVTLPHEGVKAQAGSEESDWTPTDWFYKACFSQPDAFSATSLKASKVIQMLGPQTVETEGALVFATEQDAAAFLKAMGPDRQACDKHLSAKASRVRVDHVTPITALNGYDESVAASVWVEELISGKWHPVPDGGLYVMARKGNVVVFAQFGGEFVGNSLLLKDPWPVNELSGRLVPLLPQVCKVAGNC